MCNILDVNGHIVADLDDGILDIAQENAEAYIGRFILSLGFKTVDFTEVVPVEPTVMP